MSAGELAAFLAMSPPRRVPAGLERAARRLSVPILVAFVGGIFLAAGILLSAKLFPWALLEDWKLLEADAATASGRVTAVADTSWRIDKRRVVRYEFEFQPPGGQRTNGVCYTTGRSWSEGADVTVRYRPEDPGTSCIAGARRSIGDGTSAFVLLFPLAGAGLLAWYLLARRRMSALLEQGELAQARVDAVEVTRMRVNRRRVYKITLQRADARAGGALVVRSPLPDVIAFARERMQKRQPVLVLYDPAKPQRALLPEALYGPA